MSLPITVSSPSPTISVAPVSRKSTGLLCRMKSMPTWVKATLGIAAVALVATGGYFAFFQKGKKDSWTTQQKVMAASLTAFGLALTAYFVNPSFRNVINEIPAKFSRNTAGKKSQRPGAPVSIEKPRSQTPQRSAGQPNSQQQKRA